MKRNCSEAFLESDQVMTEDLIGVLNEVSWIFEPTVSALLWFGCDILFITELYDNLSKGEMPLDQTITVKQTIKIQPWNYVKWMPNVQLETVNISFCVI